MSQPRSRDEESLPALFSSSNLISAERDTGASPQPPSFEGTEHSHLTDEKDASRAPILEKSSSGESSSTKGVSVAGENETANVVTGPGANHARTRRQGQGTGDSLGVSIASGRDRDRDGDGEAGDGDGGAPGPGGLRRRDTPRPKLSAVLTDLMTPERPISKSKISYKQSFMAAVKASWLNVLLICIPLSWAFHFANLNNTLVFVFSFLAIIPLAKLLGFGTEELALRVGETLGGLLNATLGNAVELIVAILALVKCELGVVQSSLVGSILSNLLLVLGMCFFAGGVRFSEQAFQGTAAQLNSSLLVMSVIAVLIPAGFHAAFGATLDDNVERDDILKMSRGIAVILLVIYFASLVFQLWTHAHAYIPQDADSPNVDGKKFGKHRFLRTAQSVKRADARAGVPDISKVEYGDDEDDVEEPKMNVIAACILLAVVTALVGVTAEWLVDSINGLTSTGAISEEWVGLILLPIVGNAAEHVTAVTVSVKDKLDLSFGVAVGSSIQIALFVIPLLTILGWILDKPLSLLFDPFISVSLFLSVLIVNQTVQDGKSNWLEGWLLMSVYLIIAVSFWYYPSGQTEETRLFQC